MQKSSTAKTAWQAERRWRRSAKRFWEWLRRWPVWLLRLLHGVDQPNKLLGSVRYGNIVMLALSPFPGKVCGESWIPITDKLRSIENGIAQVSGASFLHVGTAVGKLPRLVGGR